MAKIRVGINGFGRIGRNFLRAHLQRGGDFEIVAANDIGDTKTMAHLLRHDSVLGTLDVPVEAGDGAITVGGHEIKFLSERDPADLPWADLGVDVAIESTGLFTEAAGRREAPPGGGEEGRHLRSGHRSGPHRRPRRQRPRVRPGAAQHHLERVVHDELRRAGREGPARGVRDRARLHDDDPRVHERPARPRSPAQGPSPGPRRRDQPHPDLDRCRPRDRGRPARPQGQGRRHVDARAGADRLGRRPRRPGRGRADGRTRSTSCSGRWPTKATSRGSSSTPTSRSSRPTSSTRRTPRSSTAA